MEKLKMTEGMCQKIEGVGEKQQQIDESERGAWRRVLIDR